MKKKTSPATAAKKRMEATFEKMRPAIQKALAHHETILPTPSPTSARRGGKKLSPDADMEEFISYIIEAKKGREYVDAEKSFHVAMRTADPNFFLRMAAAAKYVSEMPHSNSVFSKHLIAARKELARFLKTGISKPSWKQIKENVSKTLNQNAYSKASPEWTRIKSEIGKNNFAA